MNTRYKKQELFVGKTGQQLVRQAHIIIIGAGALGSASAEMLARAGIGKLTIVDRDYVEWSNLQRQQLYTEDDATKKLPKAIAAKNRLQKINSEITIEALIMDVNSHNIEQLIANTSLIVDATDNFETRLIVNDAAVKLQIPFVFGACVGSYGLQFTIIPEVTPCLHCLIDHVSDQHITCDTVGIISPAVQIVASYQVTQALQLLTGTYFEPILKSFDIWKDESSAINISSLRNNNCLTCGMDRNYPFLSLHHETKTDILCGRDAVQIRPSTNRSISLKNTYERIQHIVTHVIINSYLLSCTIENNRIVLFKDGRAIIHGTHQPDEARTIYNKIVQHNL
ncbi:ThiF family adenylyltransferase [Bacillus massiliigorillae]|uniref:ThiF family adenylyltransferase n=1 Tax=Bacillus massiliigorillae TaxID=1243664 RepID=UPI0003A6E71A|nr:ThiF family adenylyltransferase [Bacillus massiliigorillae]